MKTREDYIARLLSSKESKLSTIRAILEELKLDKSDLQCSQGLIKWLHQQISSINYAVLRLRNKTKRQICRKFPRSS